MATVDDFLKPQSMLTPGVAGGIVMTIANTLWCNFTLEPKWSALVLSFAIGAVVFKAVSLPVWQRVIYYVVNSLIIFAVAAGTNFVGTKTSEALTEANYNSFQKHVAALVGMGALIPEAFAQDKQIPESATENEEQDDGETAAIRLREAELLKKEADLAAQEAVLMEKLEALRKTEAEIQNQQAIKTSEPAGMQKERSFFRNW